MSLKPRGKGIPFPQTSEESNVEVPKRNNSSRRSAMDADSFATPGTPLRRGARPGSQEGGSEDGTDDRAGSAIRRTPKTSNSSSSSGSTTGNEGLPSIRNLLSSIDSEERASSPSTSRWQTTSTSPSAEPSPSTRSQLSGQSSRNQFRSPDQQAGGAHWRNSQSWDLKASHRPMSPTRRPPLAPSAYAHAQFMPPGQRAAYFRSSAPREDESSMQHTLQYHEHPSNAKLRALPMTLPSHDHDRSLMGISDTLTRSNSARNPSKLRRHEVDSDLQAHERDEASRESGSSRRRHTLSAFDEPARIQGDSKGVASENQDMATTPRALHHHKLLSPIHRIPESPTTPTATATHVAHRGTDPEQYRQHGRSGSDAALPPNASTLYMHNSMHASGSLPSLVPYGPPPTSLGVRKSSFEDQREKAPVWSGHTGPYNGSETLTSPHSSVWHSRSSTLDSVDTISSTASFRSGGSTAAAGGGPLPHAHHHSLSSSSMGARAPQRFAANNIPRTPTHARQDYNRNWRFPMSQHSGADDNMQAMTEAREGGTPTGPAMSASPFANLSLSSPPDPRHVGPSIYSRHQPYDIAYNRPRAQTMGYHDRPIAPLPSHAVVGQAPQQSPHYHAPTRSLSSQSISSLPQRVSSMQLENWGHPAPLDFQSPAAVAGRSPTSTVIVSAKTGAGGGSSANKYTCTWCGKRFSRPSSLKIHYHSHTGEKPYTCDEPGCGRNFSVQSNLRRHQKSHASFSERIGGDSELQRSGSLHSRHASDASHSTGSYTSQRRDSGTLGQPWGSPISSAKNRHAPLSTSVRRPSISSSNAGDGKDEEDEEEGYELDEEEAARSLGSMKSRRFQYESEDDRPLETRFEHRHQSGNDGANDDADEAMHDVRQIQDEAPSSSPASSLGSRVPSFTAGAPVARLPPMAPPGVAH